MGNIEFCVIGIFPKTQVHMQLKGRNKMCYRKFFKQVICVLALFFCSCAHNSKYAGNSVIQSVDSTYHIGMLKGTIWEAVDLTGREKRTEIYKDSMMTAICQYPRISHTDTTNYYYYLSDVIPSTFDFSRVGKDTYGRYLVLCHHGYTSSRQIIWLSLSKLYLKRTGSDDTIRFKRRTY